MREPLPRWIAIVMATMTVVVGMLGAAAISSGWLVYERPFAVRDGQYVMGVGLLAAAGFWGALPVGILSGVLVYRDTRLFGALALQSAASARLPLAWASCSRAYRQDGKAFWQL